MGTGSQLAQAVLFAQAEVEGTAVPFDSGSPALTAVVGDQVQVATVQLGEAKPQIDAGKVVPLLAFSAERNQFLPDVPTAVEEGYDVPVSQYRAVAAPKGLPEDVKARLVESIDAAIATDTYTSFNENNLLTPHEISGRRGHRGVDGARREVQGAHRRVRHQPRGRLTVVESPAVRATEPVEPVEPLDDDALAAAGPVANLAACLVTAGVGVAGAVAAVALGLGTPSAAGRRALAARGQRRRRRAVPRPGPASDAGAGTARSSPGTRGSRWPAS